MRITILTAPNFGKIPKNLPRSMMICTDGIALHYSMTVENAKMTLSFVVDMLLHYSCRSLLSLSISLSWFDLNNSDSFVLLFIFVSFENWAIQLYVTQSKLKLIVMVLILFPRNGYSVVWKSWCGYPIVLKPRKWFWWHENQVRIPTTVNRCERARFSLSIFSLFCFSTFRWQFIFSNRFYVTAALFFPRLQKK